MTQSKLASCGPTFLKLEKFHQWSSMQIGSKHMFTRKEGNPIKLEKIKIEKRKVHLFIEISESNQ